MMPGNVTAAPLSFHCGSLLLEGILHRPEGTGAGVVVCHPHPLRGGDMDNHVVTGICRALAERGITALRFNFRGTGGSDGRHDDGRGERDDVIAALDALVAQAGIDSERIGLAGYSFGAAMTLRAADDPRVRALALVSLPARSAAGPPVNVPALVITGEHDSIAPPDTLRALASGLPEGSRMEVVLGVDHFWWDGLPLMVGKVADFFEQQLLQAA
jgi:alpha/beta superfamily hydrolase